MQRPPLAGIRVIEAGAAVAIPLGGRILADFGAEVIKIESAARPELGRVTVFLDSAPGATYWEKGGYYTEINRNKIGVSLDLSTDDGRSTFLDLVKVADILLENFTPRVMRNFGLEYEQLRAVCPDLIMVSSTGFGHSGPWQNYRAYGFTLEPTTGISHFTGYEHGTPVRSGITYTDTPAAYSAVLAVMTALEYREMSGVGQWIDLSQYEVGVAFNAEGVIAAQAGGDVETRRGNRDPETAPQGVYRCQGDDRWIAISVRTDREWQALCQILGRPELAVDNRFDTFERRKAAESKIDPIIATWAAEQDGRTAVDALQAAGIPASLVLDSRDLLLDPHLADREFFGRIRHSPMIPELGSRTYPGAPWKLSGRRPPIGRAAPLLGEHTGEVLRDLLGWESDQVAGLFERGVAANRPAGARNIHQGTTTMADLERIGEIRDYDPDYQRRLGNEP